MILSIHYSLNNSWVMYKLYLRYSTSFGERESRSFRDEPETFISILISTTPMHLESFLCTQHCRHVRSHWSGVFNLLKLDRIAKKKEPEANSLLFIILLLVYLFDSFPVSNAPIFESLYNPHKKNMLHRIWYICSLQITLAST